MMHDIFDTIHYTAYDIYIYIFMYILYTHIYTCAIPGRGPQIVFFASLSGQATLEVRATLGKWAGTSNPEI